MIDVRIDSGNGSVLGVYQKWGIIYISSDNIFCAPIKGFETTSYAEVPGENIDARTTDDAFDYTVKFLVETENKGLNSANSRIKTINSEMYAYEKDNLGRVTDVKKFKEWTFYNDYKHVKIVGIPTPIEEVKELWRDQQGRTHDVALFELKIHVADPKKCDFNYYK